MSTYAMAVPAMRGTPFDSSLFTVPRRQNTITTVQRRMATGTLKMLMRYTKTPVSKMPPTHVHTTKNQRGVFSMRRSALSDTSINPLTHATKCYSALLPS